MTSSRNQRQIHAYCVGQAKSGTASLWGAYRTSLNAAHEPERSEVLARVLQSAEGTLNDFDMAKWLRNRDARLQLDMDVSWCNFFLLEHLVETFPKAKFIVLVRDCYTWIESVIGHMLTREIPADVRAFMEFWFRTAKHPHGVGEERLQKAGLFSLTAYLAAWKDHITKCVATIPKDRRLIVRTHELTASLPAIAEFLGIPAGKLDSTQCHLNRGAWEGRIGDYIDSGLVEVAVDRVCRQSMETHFPEAACIEDAYCYFPKIALDPHVT